MGLKPPAFRLRPALNRLLQSGIRSADLAIVLGSAFGEFTASLGKARSVPYSSIPGMPVARVPGHAGKLFFAEIHSRRVLLFSGRPHFYEGFSMEEVGFPVRLAASLNVQSILLTNAAGGIRPGLKPGDFMILHDHINMMGCHPLRGPEASDGSRFVDLSQVYDPLLRKKLKSAIRKAGLRPKEGVYAAMAGPSYETPAEIRALRRLGADAVGMSTVPEAIVARHEGLRVAALSCITNSAAGTSSSLQAISHTEVTRTGKDRAAQAVTILLEFIKSTPA